ncbi:hypothetical protein [Amycolatopsis sp.]|uniref:hypothetical protein n=1 Tax=Amycolatopsis sp. TaxID=37632 RepID=UPI0039C85596
MAFLASGSAGFLTGATVAADAGRTAAWRFTTGTAGSGDRPCPVFAHGKCPQRMIRGNRPHQQSFALCSGCPCHEVSGGSQGADSGTARTGTRGLAGRGRRAGRRVLRRGDGLERPGFPC